jgi:hypothetical protein
MKILPVGAELFLADRETDGQRDMTTITAALRNFVNAPKSCEKNGGCMYGAVGTECRQERR